MQVYVAFYGATGSLRLLPYQYDKIVEMAEQPGFNTIYFEAELN